MKKILNFIALLFLGVTVTYTVYIYNEIAKTERAIYQEIRQTILTEKISLTKIFQELATKANELSELKDSDQLKSAVSKSIPSIIYLDANKNFSAGFAMSEDGHIYKTTLPAYLNLEKDLGWIEIDLNSLLRTSKAIYIIPNQMQGFTLITYDLSLSLNSLRSLSYGFNTYAHVEKTNPSFIQTGSNPNPFNRLLNSSIQIQRSVTSGYSLVFTGTWQDIYPYPTATINAFLILITTWGISILGITGVFLQKTLQKQRSLWTLSFIFNFLCACLIIFFFSDLKDTSFQTSQRTELYKKTREFFSKDPSVIIIPTAVYLDSLSFPNDTSYLVTGFISQIYPKDTPMTMGFLFPYQSTLYTSTVKEISRWESESSITILWHFGVALTAPFSTTFFPFDRRIAQITLWPKELHKNIIFFPNFLNFTTLNALQKPGFDTSIDPIGWDIIDSNFTLRNEAPYNFFSSATTDSPLTYVFAITLIRNFLGAFLSNILVLVLCIFVAFLVLFIPRDSLLDSLFATISIFVGLIFIAVTNHSSLRETLEVSSFAYVEYLFISFYILLLAITIDFIVRRPKTPTPFDKNFILAILYWPILLGTFTLMLAFSILT